MASLDYINAVYTADHACRKNSSVIGDIPYVSMSCPDASPCASPYYTKRNTRSQTDCVVAPRNALPKSVMSEKRGGDEGTGEVDDPITQVFHPFRTWSYTWSRYLITQIRSRSSKKRAAQTAQYSQVKKKPRLTQLLVTYPYQY